MAGSKPDEREVAPPPSHDSVTSRASGSMKKAPPPLPAGAARSSRSMRAAAPATAESAPDAESATLYSRVGRRSSPGIPAVSISVESVRVPVASSPPPSVRPKVEAHPPTDLELESPVTERAARLPISTRPAAPEPFAADQGGGESIAQTFDRLLGSELDSSFVAIKRPSEQPPVAGSLSDVPAELVEVRQLFEQLAANHVRPVRELVIDLRWGEASRECLAVCGAAIESLRRASQKLELNDLLVALDAFAAAADPNADADIDRAAVIEGPARDRILAAYERLVEVMPKAFALDLDRAQRESHIVQSLLLRLPEVRTVTIERLHAAGLNGIAMLADARPHEVADAAGIAPDLAARIVEAFRAYRAERHAHSPDATHAHERGRVDALLNELEAQHASFEQASEAWTPQATAEKKRLRRARHETLMAISVLLARLGEIALLQELEKLPFERKLERLRWYLKEAQTPFAHLPLASVASS